MLQILHTVQCSECGMHTQHPVSSIERMVQLQSRRSGDLTRINLACPRCNGLTLSPIFSGPHADLRLDLERFPKDASEFVVTLECDTSGCDSDLIILAPAPKGISQSFLSCYIDMKWHSSSAVCEHGHPSALPLRVVSIRELQEF